MKTPLRNLVVVLGDQLDDASSALEGFDPQRDCLWMAEVDQESTHVWTHKARIALFLSAMRHFRERMRERGWTVDYLQLGEHAHVTLADALAAALEAWQPETVVWVRPGEWRLREALKSVVEKAGARLQERQDLHFLLDPEDFAQWCKGRKQARMEHFYRWMRQRTGILMDGKDPEGGRWNFDAENRGSFDSRGPGMLPAPASFDADAITREVLEQVEQRFAAHPGSLDNFDWAVTPDQAQQALDDFIAHRLTVFGQYQDAMWTKEPWLYHSRLSAAMNLKLLHPRSVIDAAVGAWQRGHAPIEAVEGFVRQILGWREFVRGLYWMDMPGWLDANVLQADAPLPEFYWTGDTEMNCLADSLGQVMDHGYGHHIQRLMVTGLFALLLGVRPREIHAWYLAMYVDAVEWVELPNVLGMSQFADGGRLASKPYVASGKYIQRMSNYCSGCRYDPALNTGEKACPFTTLYWDFLERHQERFGNHPRAALQWRNLQRLSDQQREKIAEQASALRKRFV